MNPIYLDYNASTPVDPKVLDEMLPYLKNKYGNPSSSHPYGVALRAGIEQARERVATLLGCEASEIIFTSGATESNNMVIKGIAKAAGKGKHFITSQIEHPAVLEAGVIGIPDPDLGQRVTAYVTLKPGHEPSPTLAAEIIERVKAVIAPYKAPKEIKFAKELPKTATGKILRRELRAKATL